MWSQATTTSDGFRVNCDHFVGNEQAIKLAGEETS
jgi:hypothetical protein